MTEWQKHHKPLLTRLAESVARERDAILELQELAEELQDHSQRMRTMIERLEGSRVETLDTPGPIKLPRILTPEREDEAA